jgi:pimeloyl-ACP methyl ester carboxylesterase
MDGRRSVAALRWPVAIVIALTGLVWVAWRSGDRPPIDEVAVAEARLGIDLESRQVETGTARLHVVFAGPEEGEPVLLLHGFPELWYSWHGVMGALAKRGYRVIAPDLRGYNRSEKPPGRDAYSGARYEEDVVGLLDALGIERVRVAGHDVGGGVTWRLIFTHPGRLEQAVALSAVHPMAWERASPNDDPESISWFRTFFRLPFLPELVSRAGGWWLLSRNLRETSQPGTFEGETLAIFQSAWARENAISTMMNVYRAGWEDIPLPPDGRPRIPVRVIQGGKDAFLPEAASDVTAEFLPEGAVTLLPELSHWLLLEDPEQVASLMLTFFEEPAH